MLVVVSPLFAVANAYGAGLTDFDMSSIYGTVRLSNPPSYCPFYVVTIHAMQISVICTGNAFPACKWKGV